MTEWWTSLELLDKILWSLAIFSSLVFIVQSALTFTGADTGHDFDTSFDGDVSMDGTDTDFGGTSHLYTWRNLINFLLGFSWSAILLRNSVTSTALLMVIAVAAGAVLVAGVMMLFKWLSSMQQSGNINVKRSAVGCEGTVYLTIPASRSGEGKVQISIQGAVREYDAMTEGEALTNQTPIKVVEVLNDRTLLVEPLDSLIV